MKPVFRRSAVIACALAAGLACQTASAQTFTRIQSFGDSFVDTGRMIDLIRSMDPANPALALYPTGRFTGDLNMIDYLSRIYGAPFLNYAFGGAMTGTLNTVTGGPPGFAHEWFPFVSSGGVIGPRDLTVVSIGGNDARSYYQAGGTMGGVAVAAATSAAQAMAGVSALVGAGARTMVFTAGDVSLLPEAQLYGAQAAVGGAYSTAYNLAMQQGLAGLTSRAVRIEYVDLSLVSQIIATHYSTFGLLPAPCPIATCIGSPTVQSQYMFYVDGIHPTAATSAIIAQYISNRLAAPLTIGPNMALGSLPTLAFTHSMFGRLDLFNGEADAVPGRALGYAADPARKGPLAEAPRVRQSPLSAYILVDGGGGRRSAQATASGYRWDNLGGTVGLEYRIAPNALLGAAFNYSNPTQKLAGGLGSSEAQNYQFGLYGGWNGRNAFLQGVATLGWQDYDLRRAGVLNPLVASPTGTTAAAALKAGYLFDAGAFRVGPIAGLTWARARLGGYTETGDPALALRVGAQTQEAWIGSVGAQLRAPLMLGATTLNTYVNLTLESDLKGNGRLVNYAAVSAPLIVNAWTIPGQGSRLYGRVAAGASANLGANWAMSINLTSTLARKGGDDYSGSVGLKYAF